MTEVNEALRFSSDWTVARGKTVSSVPQPIENLSMFPSVFLYPSPLQTSCVVVVSLYVMSYKSSQIKCHEKGSE